MKEKRESERESERGEGRGRAMLLKRGGANPTHKTETLSDNCPPFCGRAYWNEVSLFRKRL